MSNSRTITAGSCICGAVTLTFSGPPKDVTLCYCKDCQRNAGGPCQLNLYVPKSNVTVKEDPPQSMRCYTFTETQSGKPKEKYFCGICAATLFTVPFLFDGDLYVIKSGIIQDGSKLYTPTTELFGEERPAYLHIQVESKE